MFTIAAGKQMGDTINMFRKDTMANGAVVK
jgi:hypothetical protein